MPLVVIEVDAHEAPRTLANTLAAACSEAIPQGECRYDEPEGETPIAVATVKWDGKGEHSVRIEVGTKRRGEPEWLSKTLQFRSVDPRAERWRSVGLTIATLVRELSSGVPGGEPSEGKGSASRADAAGGASNGPAATKASVPAATADAASRTESGPSSTPPPAPESAEVPRAAAGSVLDDDGEGGSSTSAPGRDFRTPFWLDVGVLAGPAFAAGDTRVGGFVGLGVRLASSPFFARFSLGHEVQPMGDDALGARYTTLSAGAGAALRWRPAQLTLEPRIAFLLEQVGVSAKDTQGRSDESSQWGGGLQAGASLVWELAWVSPVLGVEAFWRGPPTDVLLKNQVVATVPAASWTVQAGVRFFL